MPALRYKDSIIYDSSIINEFLEDSFSEVNLLPKEPAEKAKARIMIKKVQELIVPFSELLQAQTMESQKHKGQALRNKLKELNTFFAKNSPRSQEGPYLLGKQFSLIDIALLPFYERMTVVLPHYRKWQIPKTKEFQLLNDWFLRAFGRSSYQETRKRANSNYEEFLITSYKSQFFQL